MLHDLVANWRRKTGLLTRACYKASDEQFLWDTRYGGMFTAKEQFIESTKTVPDRRCWRASCLPTPSARPLARQWWLRISDGRSYCTTEDTGSTNFGSLFRIGPDGGEFHTVRDFGIVTNDGRIPNAVLEASDGLLYGTTQSGGTNNGGVIFCVDRDGTNYVVLRRFTKRRRPFAQGRPD